jgi:hypothetical protein
MDDPRLPPAVAGRSALPTFLAVESWAREKTTDARERAKGHRAQAEAEAERIRSEGEAALTQAVLDGETEALRDVESRTRDRISAARSEITSWINRAEEAAQTSMPDALEILCAPVESPGESPGESPVGPPSGPPSGPSWEAR